MIRDDSLIQHDMSINEILNHSSSEIHERGDDDVEGLINKRPDNKQSRINLDAHDGLRGIMACWIMVFHCFREYRGSDIDFQGSSIMPLFFLLTGFTSAIVYNNILPSNEEIASGKTLDIPRKSLQFWTFYANRLVRVVPVYYLFSLIAIPCWLYGYGDLPKADLVGPIVTTFTFSSVIFIFIFGGALDGPGWTVQTCLWLWLCFPKLMQRTRSLSSEDLVRWIINFYYIQLVLIYVIFIPILLFSGLGFWPAFCASTMNPISRIPLLLMGMYAGELCLRTSTHQASQSSHPATLSAIWPRSYFFLYPCPPSLKCCTTATTPHSEAEEESFWTRRAGMYCYGLFALTLIVSILNSVAGTNILGSVWFQAIVPWAQLEIIVSLTRQSSRTCIHKALTTPLARFLGKISMTIYLVHYVIIWYVEWGINDWHAVNWPTNDDTSVLQQWEQARQLPLWGIPLVVVITLPIATIVFYGFEEPIRRNLRI